MGKDQYQAYHEEEEMERIAQACHDKAMGLREEAEDLDGDAEESIRNDAQEYQAIANRMARVERFERVDPDFEETLHSVVTQIAGSMDARAVKWREQDMGEAAEQLEQFAKSLRSRLESRPDVEPDARSLKDMRRDLIRRVIEVTQGSKSKVAAMDYFSVEWAGYDEEQVAERRDVKVETIRWNVNRVEEWIKEQADDAESQSTLMEAVEEGDSEDG